MQVRSSAKRSAELASWWIISTRLSASVSVTRRLRQEDVSFKKMRRVWDSRGRPTVEAEVLLDTGASGRAISP